MKLPDGGFRPALNVRLATTTDAARAIVGVTSPTAAPTKA
jgi:hypothetical protein